MTKSIATVILMDSHADVVEAQSVVAKFKDVVYTGDQQSLINQLLLDEDIKGAIAKHNDSVRNKTINQTTLDRTGKEVMLRPVKFNELDILVS